MKQIHAIGTVVIAALLLSINGILLRNIQWTPLGVACFRAFFAALLQWSVVKKIRWDFPLSLWCAALLAAASISLFVISLQYTPVMNAYALFYTLPVFVVIFSFGFNGETPTILDLIAVTLVSIGIYLFFRDSLDNGCCCSAIFTNTQKPTYHS